MSIHSISEGKHITMHRIANCQRSIRKIRSAAEGEVNPRERNLSIQYCKSNPIPNDGSLLVFNSKFLLILLAVLSCQLTYGDCYIRRAHNTRMDISATTLTPTPKFDKTHSGDVTALVDKTAFLNCRVHNIRNKTVSWIRHRDIHLLTVGKYTYTSDQRFRSLHEDDSDDWILKINYVQARDSGIYECQVSTTPPISHFVALNVVKPLTYILGGPDIHINKGSTINLTCVVQYAKEPPHYINWHHGNKIISYDSDRGGVTVIIEKGDLTTSTLLIQNAADSDSGMYDCDPSNSPIGNITVHVLNDAFNHGPFSTDLLTARRHLSEVPGRLQGFEGHPEAVYGGQNAYTSFTFNKVFCSVLANFFFLSLMFS